MRDWQEYVGNHLSLSSLPPARQLRLTEEVARQLEDCYQEAVSGGSSAMEADRITRNQITDWEAFSRDLIAAEPRQASHTMQHWMDRVEETQRTRGGVRWRLAEFSQDIRFALRLLRRDPLFTLIAVLTLALGIGANTAIFSFVYQVLWKDLPFPQPNQLVAVWETDSGGEIQSVAYANSRELRRGANGLVDLTSLIAQSVNLTGDGEPQRVRGGFVTDGFFNVVGTPPLLGRTFRPQDDQQGSELVTVLNYAAWRDDYSSDEQVLGRRILLNGEPYTVIGVMPEDFRFPIDDIDVWMPMHKVTVTLSDATRFWWSFARLQPDTSMAQAEAELNSLMQGLRKEYPEMNEGAGIHLEPFHEMLVRNTRQTLLLVMGAVGVVLLIGCANVATLLLARGARRSREMAVRAALGASRSRALSQILTETTVLSLAGAVVGLLLAFLARDLLTSLFADQLHNQPAKLDHNVLLFALGLSLLTGFLFGIVPALHFSSPNIVEKLREGGRGVGVSGRAMRVTNGLAVAQIALAVVLLSGATLLMRSVGLLEGIQTGFNRQNVLTLEYRLPTTKYSTPESQAEFHRRIRQEIASIPGVKSAGLIRRVPFSGNRGYVSFRVPGQEQETEEGSLFAFSNTASPEIFDVLGIPMLAGRTLNGQDSKVPLGVVVNRHFVETFFPDRNPLGQRILMDRQEVQATIVGVVEDIHYLSLEESRRYQFWTHYASSPSNFTSVALRTNGNPLEASRQVQEAIWRVDKDQPMWKIRTLDSMVADSLENRSLVLRVLSAFALVAVFLAGLGIYGVVSQSVDRRRHEMAVRLTMGANSSDLLRMILRRGAFLVLIGVLVGIGGALLSGRLLEGLLYGVSPTDLWTLLSVSGLLTLIALAACLKPALRAGRVDPVEVLAGE